MADGGQAQVPSSSAVASPSNAIEESEGNQEKPAESGEREGAQSEAELPVELSAAEKVGSLLKSRDLKQAHAAFSSIQHCQHTPITEQEFQRHLLGLVKMRNDPDHGVEWSRHLEGEEERSLKLWNECRDLCRTSKKGTRWACWHSG